MIKIAHSTVNPYDRILFKFHQGHEGFVLGSEGTGTVIKLGEGVDASLLNKKVSFLGNSYQKFTVTHATGLIVYDTDVDLKTTANAFVNPVTALGQFHLTKQSGSGNAICLAGGSQLAT